MPRLSSRVAAAWPPMAARLPSGIRLAAELPRRPGDIGGDDVRGVPVQAGPGTVVSHRGARISVRSGLLNIPQRDPASSAAVMNACLRVCGLTCLAIWARRVARRTILAAPCRSSRRPSAAVNNGPSVRSLITRSMARAVRGASGMVTTLPPLRVMTRVRCPRSRPRCSISAPVPSETRSPLSASREISACSAGGPSPAATRSAPSSLRSRAVACDS